MRTPGRVRVRPTVFGLVLLTVVAVGAVLRPATSDPSVTGLILGSLAGVLLVGTVWPILVTRWVAATVVAAPPELLAGQLGSLQVGLTGRSTGLALSCSGSGISVLDVVSPGSVRLPISIDRRGVYRRVEVDIGSDAPFGVVRAQATRVLDLPAELLVGPRPMDMVLEAGELRGDAATEEVTGTSPRGDSVRSVRPYSQGDPPHLVHWPTTARSGSLVVKEIDPPADRGVAIVVDLRDPSGAGDVERVASLALGAVEQLLGEQVRVVLCTAQTDGPVAAEVADPAEARRRLARATDGEPELAPQGWPVRRLAVEP